MYIILPSSAKHAYAPETWETWEGWEGWEQNSTFRSSLNTPGACQEWLGIVWRVCASSCQELRVPGRVRSNTPLQEQSQGSWSDWKWHGVGRVRLWIDLTSLYISNLFTICDINEHSWFIILFVIINCSSCHSDVVIMILCCQLKIPPTCTVKSKYVQISLYVEDFLGWFFIPPFGNPPFRRIIFEMMGAKSKSSLCEDFFWDGGGSMCTQVKIPPPWGLFFEMANGSAS